MATALAWVFGLVLALWVLTAAPCLIAYGAVGNPSRGALVGWGVSFLGWLAVPVGSVVALLAALDGEVDGRSLLPLLALAVQAGGFGLGALLARRSPERR